MSWKWPGHVSKSWGRFWVLPMWGLGAKKAQKNEREWSLIIKSIRFVSMSWWFRSAVVERQNRIKNGRVMAIKSSCKSCVMAHFGQIIGHFGQFFKRYGLCFSLSFALILMGKPISQWIRPKLSIISHKNLQKLQLRLIFSHDSFLGVTDGNSWDTNGLGFLSKASKDVWPIFCQNFWPSPPTHRSKSCFRNFQGWTPP